MTDRSPLPPDEPAVHEALMPGVADARVREMVAEGALAARAPEGERA